MNIISNGRKISDSTNTNLSELIDVFNELFEPLEKNHELVFIDMRTKAFYIECHVKANKLVELSTIDVPLDPDNQENYRANRDIVEDHSAYLTMKQDALQGRSFSNIIGEYTIKYNKPLPFKIIGGQHRFNAIKDALDKGINEFHGIKVYFLLDTAQRLDVQLISNTNIAVAGDLLDRMYETVMGPELRDWCQAAGLLDHDCDFSDRKQRGSRITVRGSRSFILSFFEGRKYDPKDFDRIRPEPIIAKTGVADQTWNNLRTANTKMWSDKDLLDAGKQYAKLNNSQFTIIAGRKGSPEYAEKAMNYAIISAWAYTAGLLNGNKVRLERHFALSGKNSTDPLNATALAKAKHKTDPENYRGLGTRTDMKERGRLTELFYAQAEKGEGITAEPNRFCDQKVSRETCCPGS